MPEGIDLVLDLVVDRVDLVDDGANTGAFIQLFKRKEKTIPMDFDQIIASMDPAQADVIRQEVAKAKSEVPAETAAELAKAKELQKEAEEKFQSAFDEAETMKAKVKAMEVKDPEPDFEEVLKSMPAEMQTMMKKMKAQKEAAEQLAKDLSEKALHEEAVAKAASLKALPVDEATLIETIKSASPQVMEVLKAANKAIEDNVPFEEVGKSKANAAGKAASAEQAWEQIEKKAKVISEEQKISFEKAVGVAIKENKELYEQYLAGGAN